MFSSLRRRGSKGSSRGSSSKRQSNAAAGSNKEGWMVKEGHTIKNWKRRYFVLTADGTLLYYKDKSDSKARGSVPLLRYSVAAAEEGEKEPPLGMGVVIKLSPTDEASRDKVFWLVTQTDDERRDWLAAMREVQAENSGAGWKSPYARPKAAQEKASAPEGWKQITVGDSYVFHVPADYTADGTEATSGDLRAKYTGKNGARLVVRARSMARISELPLRRTAHLRVSAEKMAKETMGWGQDWAVMESTRYEKKNVTGDIALWNCWLVWIRSEQEDYRFVLGRRWFAAPVGDTYQEFSFSLKTSVQPGVTIDTTVQSVCDCFGPVNKTALYDMKTVQAIVDHLVADDAAYGWYRAQLNVSPSCWSLIEAFVNSLMVFLTENKLTMGRDFGAAGKKPLVSKGDPWKCLRDLVDKEAKGDVPEMLPRSNWPWHMRVAHVAAWAADGGLHPGLTMSLLSQAEDKAEGAAKEMLRRLLNYFIHVTPQDQDAYPDAPLSTVLSVFTDTASNATFNARMMCRLLDLGYVRSAVRSKSDTPGAYATFLTAMLRKFSSHVSIRVAVAEQIALNSHHQDDSAAYVKAGAVPVLAQLIKGSPDDEFLLEAVVKSLVNITAATPAAKAQVVREGVVAAVQPLLETRNEELVAPVCSLLKNLAVDQASRSKIAAAGAAEALMNLLRGNAIPDYDPSTKVVVHASAALWNLAADAKIKQAMSDKGAVGMLVGLLKRYAKDPDNAAMTKVCGALMALATDHPANRKELGELGAVALLTDIARNVDGSPPVLVRNALGALTQLSADPEFLKQMIDVGFHKEMDTIRRVQQPQIPNMVDLLSKKFAKAGAPPE